MTGRIQRLRVEGFRSIRHLEIEFGDVNLVVGPNGCGKSNLFNAFRLLKSSMQGRLGIAIAEQGGLESIRWAGTSGKGPVRMFFLILADPFEYSLEIGLRPQSEFPLFPLDPQIKSETVKLGGRVMVDRKTSVAHMRELEGPMHMRLNLVDSESIFAQIQDAERYPYMYSLRDTVERWTFYHEFRTDASSPLRRPALPTFSGKLYEDGSNLGPLLYVVDHRGEVDELKTILGEAFPGSELEFTQEQVNMVVDGIQRAITPAEMSDGTLKLLCLAGACFGVHHPFLMAFNEPETSLNAAAVPYLADMLTHASKYSQLWITTHSEQLTQCLRDRLACRPIRLDKIDGETVMGGRSQLKGYRAEEDE